MTLQRTKIALMLLLTLSLFTVAGPAPIPVQGQSNRVPVVGVWSNACGSSNITLTNPSCPSLAVNSLFSVEINVTNAPAFNSYEFFLNYDPFFINATSFDVKTQTVFPDGGTNLVTNPFSPRGTVRLSVTNFASPSSYTGSNGTLVHITFKVLEVGVSPLVLAAGIANPSGANTAWTRLINAEFIGPTPVTTVIEVETTDGYFKNEPVKLGPIASFTYSPSSPRQGIRIFFNASASYDPDGAINIFKWDFGNFFSATSFAPTYEYVYQQGNTVIAGNFSVRLTVVDNTTKDCGRDPTVTLCFQGMQVQRIPVTGSPFHDVSIEVLAVTPAKANIGQAVAVRVVVSNLGFFSETFNLTVTYGHQAGSIIGSLGSESGHSLELAGLQSFPYTLNTTGLSPGFYSVIAKVDILQDNRTSNNERSQTVQVLEVSTTSSSPLYVAIAAVSVIAALVVVGLFLRRRTSRAREAE